MQEKHRQRREDAEHTCARTGVGERSHVFIQIGAGANHVAHCVAQIQMQLQTQIHIGISIKNSTMNDQDWHSHRHTFGVGHSHGRVGKGTGAAGPSDKGSLRGIPLDSAGGEEQARRQHGGGDLHDTRCGSKRIFQKSLDGSGLCVCVACGRLGVSPSVR